MKKRILSAALAAALVIPFLSAPLESFAQTNSSPSAKQAQKNRAPSINGISSPTMLAVDQSGTWTVKASDPENGNLSYSVDWGDTASAKSKLSAKSSGFVQSATFTHAYSAAGTYTVVFTVMDEAGLTSKTSSTVRVGSANQNAIVITNLGGTSTKPTKAVVEWNTNIKADSAIWLNKTSPVDTTKKPHESDDDRTKEHEIELKKLDPDTTYYYIVKSTSKNSSAISKQMSFKTPPTNDNKAPKIIKVDGPDNLDVDEEGTWMLEARDPQNGSLEYSVDWGDTVNPLAKVLSKMMPAFTQTSTFTHTYDEAGTYTITFKVRSENGKTAQKTVTVEVEEDEADTTAPVISDIEVDDIESDEATIEWETNEDADSAIFYSTSSPVVIGNAGTVEVGSTELDTDHSLTADNLTASTTYYVLVRSKDSSGNTKTSSQISFTTAGM